MNLCFVWGCMCVCGGEGCACEGVRVDFWKQLCCLDGFWWDYHFASLVVSNDLLLFPWIWSPNPTFISKTVMWKLRWMAESVFSPAHMNMPGFSAKTSQSLIFLPAPPPPFLIVYLFILLWFSPTKPRGCLLRWERVTDRVPAGATVEIKSAVHFLILNLTDVELLI